MEVQFACLLLVVLMSEAAVGRAKLASKHDDPYRHLKNRHQHQVTATLGGDQHANEGNYTSPEIEGGQVLHQPQHRSVSRDGKQARPSQNIQRPYAGRHVCTTDEVVTKPVQVVESYCKPVYKSYSQPCTNGSSVCTAFRVQYDTIYRTVVKYQMMTEKKHACCPGWTYHAPKQAHGCSQAICSQECKNGGSCVRPDVCICPAGYTGPTCETDVDECANSNAHKCHQLCINSFGSYSCGCHDGFQLQEDNRSCKFRLDLVPELQQLLVNYEAMSKRLAVLEVSRDQNVYLSAPSTSVPTTVDAAEFQATIANMTRHIVTLESTVAKLQHETMLIVNSTNSMESVSDYSLSSLSEQVGLLEERLADCMCTPATNQVKSRH